MKRFCFPALLVAAMAFTAAPVQGQVDDVPKAAPANAEPAKAEPTKAVPVNEAKAIPKARPLSVTVQLVSDAEIEGTLTDTTQLQMQTSFGTASIPLSEVAGIRFASANDATTTVVMLNGDSITGATDVKLMTVETEWGTASINGPSISSIMFVPGLTWNPATGLNGKRWSLADVKKSAPNTQAPQGGPSTQTNRSFGLPVPQPQFNNGSRPFNPNR